MEERQRKKKEDEMEMKMKKMKNKKAINYEEQLENERERDTLMKVRVDKAVGGTTTEDPKSQTGKDTSIETKTMGAIHTPVQREEESPQKKKR